MGGDLGIRGRLFVLSIAASASLAAAGPSGAAVRPGSLDQTFGSGGFALVQPGCCTLKTASSAVQADGKVVVAGQGYYEGTDPACWCGFLARVDASGALDTTFGMSGYVWNTNAGGGFDSVRVQADGKIVAFSPVLIARYLPTGLLDSSYGAGGEVRTPPFGSGYSASALQADGKAIVVHNGRSDPGGSLDQVVAARYMPDGTADPSFGSHGVAVVDGIPFEPEGVAALADGRIVATGLDGSEHGLVIVALTASGALDQTFGSAGVYRDGALSAAPGIVAAGGGSFYTTGWRGDAAGTTAAAFVARFGPSGAPDPSFGTNGLASIPAAPSTVRNFGWGLTVARDGKLLVAGSSYVERDTVDNPFWELEVARLLPTGAIDESFGRGGIEVVPLQHPVAPDSRLSVRGQDIVQQLDGRIIVTGLSDTAVVLARLAQDGSALPADTTPPETTITGPESGSWSAGSSISLRFKSDEWASSFQCRVDNGAPVLCFSSWGSPYFTAGTTHTISVSAVDDAGNVDPTPDTRTFRIVSNTNTCGQFTAEYFMNTSLSGTPDRTACEVAPPAYNWGLGGPGGGIPNDNFSARWTGYPSFSAGKYTFSVQADDGVRLWVDGTLLVDAWKEQAATAYSATIPLTDGHHDVKVEYYEGTGNAVVEVGWSPAAASAADACTAGQFAAEYYANMLLTGIPALSRCEEGAPRYDWGQGSPAAEVPSDGFSARWRGTVSFPGGATTFTVRADDGVRLWLDDVLLVDAWVDQAPTTYTVSRDVAAGAHRVRVEYFEHGGGAVAQVSWSTAPSAPPPSSSCTAGQFDAQYFTGTSLSGTAVLERCEATAPSYDWALGGPGNGIPNDGFSARWTGSPSFTAGDYVFTVRADDGVRFWVDGSLVVDAWKDQGATSYSATVPLAAGAHALKLEYYESTGNAVATLSWSGGQAPPPPPSSGCPADQFAAQYFSGATLGGSPVLTRCEAGAPTYDWGLGGPGNGIANDGFSARWVGRPTFAAGDTIFNVRADDGVRLWVDGTLVVDGWKDQAATSYSATVPLAAGAHDVKVEYYEQTGNALVQVSWTGAAAPPPPPPPPPAPPSPPPPPDCGAQFSAQYFGGTALDGDPLLSRCEASAPDYQWALGGPGSGVPNDGFSARWIGKPTFAAGTYTFTARADDGVRVWVDGTLVVDAWRDQAATTYTASVPLAAGSHEIKVEYYEKDGNAVARLSWVAG